MDMNRSAQILGKELAKEGVEIKHTKLLDIISRANGFKDYESSKEKEYICSATIDPVTFHFFGFHSLKARNREEAIEKFEDEVIRAGLFLVGENEDGEVSLEKPGWIVPYEDELIVDIEGIGEITED